MKFDWKQTLRTIAPALGTALGGPMVGLAVRTVSETLLGRSDATEDEIAAALQGATPDQMMELKKADYAFQAHMAELEIDLERISQEDRASARQREERVGGYANPVLASVIIGGFFAVIYYVFDAHADLFTGAQAGIVGTLIGYVSAKADQVVSYYFGSSAGSAKKTELLREAASGRRM